MTIIGTNASFDGKGYFFFLKILTEIFCTNSVPQSHNITIN